MKKNDAILKGIYVLYLAKKLVILILSSLLNSSPNSSKEWRIQYTNQGREASRI